MIDVSFIARRNPKLSDHVIRARLGKFSFIIKFDTGARDTVISSDVFHGDISDNERNKLITKLDSMNLRTKNFVSASGDEFKGYLVKARSISFERCKLPFFYYYLVVKNKRVIALLGEDFVDKCRFTHEPNDDICITQFDDISYNADLSGAISEDELIELIDAIE